jgi:hypothetical protein
MTHTLAWRAFSAAAVVVSSAVALRQLRCAVAALAAIDGMTMIAADAQNSTGGGKNIGSQSVSNQIDERKLLCNDPDRLRQKPVVLFRPSQMGT